MQTTTTTNKKFFILASLIDLISFAVLIVSFVMFPIAKDLCPEQVLEYFRLAFGIQFILVIRVFLFCVHFSATRH